MNPSRVASAYTARSEWLVDLANEVAETIVRESYVQTRLLRVEPFSVGIEAAFESPDYGVKSIFFSLEREDILDVSLQRLGQTSFRVRVDLSRPVPGRVVQQVIQWVRDEMFDKSVRLGAAAPTPDFKREVDEALRGGKYTFGDYRFRDGGVEADVQVFLSLRTLPSAVVQEAVRSLPAPQQATAWQGYIENNSVEDVISEVEFGNIPLEFVPASVQVRLAPRFLYENRARVSLEVLVGSLDGMGGNFNDFSDKLMFPVRDIAASDFYKVAPVAPAEEYNLMNHGGNWAITRGVLTVMVKECFWSGSYNPDGGPGVTLVRPFRHGVLGGLRTKVKGIPEIEQPDGNLETPARYSNRYVGLVSEYLFWEDPQEWKYDLMTVGRQAVEELVAFRAHP